MLLNKAYYTFKSLVPRRLQIRLRRYYVNRKRLQHADIWPIDPNAAQPREYGGKTGASEKEGQLPIFKGKIGSQEKPGRLPYFPAGNRELYRLFLATRRNGK